MPILSNRLTQPKYLALDGKAKLVNKIMMERTKAQEIRRVIAAAKTHRNYVVPLNPPVVGASYTVGIDKRAPPAIPSMDRVALSSTHRLSAVRFFFP